MKLYIYTTSDMHHVATITGGTNAACERAAADAYDLNDEYAATYTPAFGAVGGLVENDDAEQIAA